MLPPRLIERFLVPQGKKRIELRDYDPGWAQTPELKRLGKHVVKQRALELLQHDIADLSAAQELLFASGSNAVLIVLQAMDAAGKDGTIKHIMTGVNPQGVQVYSFKEPSAEERQHDFLWRYTKVLPERGRIGIFNRSYYEDVLVVRVHPELLEGQTADASPGAAFWEARLEDINAFERHVVRSGTLILKFFLHMSKEEQKERFLDRLGDPDKNWKFSPSDLSERRYWDAYVRAYEAALAATSTEWAPWYVVPADHKWATRSVVADVITTAIRGLHLRRPELSDKNRRAIEAARQELRDEDLRPAR